MSFCYLLGLHESSEIFLVVKILCAKTRNEVEHSFSLKKIAIGWI